MGSTRVAEVWSESMSPFAYGRKALERNGVEGPIPLAIELLLHEVVSAARFVKHPLDGIEADGRGSENSGFDVRAHGFGEAVGSGGGKVGIGQDLVAVNNWGGSGRDRKRSIVMPEQYDGIFVVVLKIPALDLDHVFVAVGIGRGNDEAEDVAVVVQLLNFGNLAAYQDNGTLRRLALGGKILP